MPTAVLASLAVVLSTAEFCATPFDGGTGDPQFCRLTVAEEIATPYFSVVIDPQFLVGVHLDGRRLQAQPSLRQSQVHFIVEVTDALDDSVCPRSLQPLSLGGADWQVCAEETTEFTAMKLTARVGGRTIVVRYGYSPLGADFATALEQMVRSIKVSMRSNNAFEPSGESPLRRAAGAAGHSAPATRSDRRRAAAQRGR